MKHSVKITLAIVLLFLAAQFVGLFIVNHYVDQAKSAETGQIEYSSLPFGFERPDIPQGQSFIYILIGVLVGTAVFLVLIRLKKVSLWKAWFFLSVCICMTFAFAAFIGEQLALALAVALGAIKVFRPNMIVHNLTEIFIYGGLAAIFVPIMNLPAAILLLLLISVYDIYAVWKSKHMVALAEFQASSKVFAGIFIQGQAPKPSKRHKVPMPAQNAVLGGGDIAFPLLFTGVVMKQVGFPNVGIISLFASAALLFLLWKAEKGKFYPAMPFITAGCLLGFGIVLLLGF